MFWKVTAQLAFDTEDEARDFYHDAQLALPKAITINPGVENQESGFIQLEECFHDVDPLQPCVDLAHAGTTP